MLKSPSTSHGSGDAGARLLIFWKKLSSSICTGAYTVVMQKTELSETDLKRAVIENPFMCMRSQVSLFLFHANRIPPRAQSAG